MNDCLLCKIIKKQIPSSIIYEDDNIIVINDINPKAPIHHLIIPKKHIVDIRGLTEHDAKLIWNMFKIIKDLSRTLPEPQAFNLISNNGAASGQSVFHMHWHFLAGKDIYSQGLKL